MRYIRGTSVKTIFELVSKVEEKLDLNGDSRGMLYGVVGNWIIQRRFLNRIVFSREGRDFLSKIPSNTIDFSQRGALRFMKAFFLPPYLFSGTSAQSILIKNNIRTFYTDGPVPFTAKIILGKTRSRDDLENEIRTREKVISSKTVNIPEIIRYELEDDPPFFIEKIIPGRVVDPDMDEALIMGDLVEDLWRMYEGYGIVFKGIDEVIDLTGAEDTVLEAMEITEWSDGWIDKKDFIKRCMEILKSGALIPFSIGHGDLSMGNMIMAKDGKIYISDWELAHEKPIIFDIRGIMNNVPRSREFFRSKLDDLAADNRKMNILSFRDQQFLSIVSIILRWKDSLRYARRIDREMETFLRKLYNRFGIANEILQQV